MSSHHAIILSQAEAGVIMQYTRDQHPYECRPIRPKRKTSTTAGNEPKRDQEMAEERRAAHRADSRTAGLQCSTIDRPSCSNLPVASSKLLLTCVDWTVSCCPRLTGSTTFMGNVAFWGGAIYNTDENGSGFTRGGDLPVSTTTFPDGAIFVENRAEVRLTMGGICRIHPGVCGWLVRQC